MNFRIHVLSAIASAFLALPAASAAEVKLPAIIGDGMVLQSGSVSSPIWGWVVPGEEVTVRFGEAKASAKAGPDGRFQVALPPLKAGLRGEVTIEGSGGSKRILKDVVTGRVWVCSGQSNMEWPLRATQNAEEAIAAASHPDLRLFTVKKAVADAPQTDCTGSWSACTPQTVPNFSAVAYYFGLDLAKASGEPVGLINTSWGGTPAESWTSKPALEAAGSLKPLLERWEKAVGEKPQEKGSPHRPANLYNAMIAPLLPFGVEGAIWYQGESNAGRAEQYRVLFPAMIADWRKAWGRELPFYFVQLANFMAEKPEPGESAWAELRDAQLHTLRTVPHTGMAVIIDIGEAKDIHPRNKLDVGKRLARWALKKQLKKSDVVESGPLFRSLKKDGEKIVLEFDHVGGGLAAGTSSEAGSAPLKGFAIAGADKKWVWAEARIQGDTVVVSSPQVKEPAAVRYAWADNPVANLYNKAGVPASPFRTDDWPMTTAGKN